MSAQPQIAAPFRPSFEPAAKTTNLDLSKFDIVNIVRVPSGLKGGLSKEALTKKYKQNADSWSAEVRARSA
jgi:hypothetical protein